MSQPKIPEAYFVTRFTHGLLPEFQSFVFRSNPVTVLAAYRLACIYEESIYQLLFPESVMQNDFSMENSVSGNYLSVCCSDKACSEMGAETFDHVERSAVDTSRQPKVDFDTRSVSSKSTEFVKFLHDALDSVAHTMSVEVFYHQFQIIRSLVAASQPWLTEAYFSSRFLLGLQEEFQIFLTRFHPVKVRAAYDLASIYEESIYLHYFPELPFQNVDSSLQTVIEEIPLTMPSYSVGTSLIDNDIVSLVVESAADVCSNLPHEKGISSLDGVVAPVTVNDMVEACPNTHCFEISELPAAKHVKDRHLDKNAITTRIAQFSGFD